MAVWRRRLNKRLSILLHSLISVFRTRRDLAFENLLLRQQLAVFKEKGVRPQLSQTYRSFWVLISKIWPRWRDVLHVVRPPIDPQIRVLIRRICEANPLWGARRIHGELSKLGINVSEAVVSKYMIRNRKPPSQGWRTFLENHAKDIIATDFFTVPTATFFSRQIESIGLTEVLTAPASPWQNAYAERVIRPRRHCGGLHHEYFRQAA